MLIFMSISFESKDKKLLFLQFQFYMINYYGMECQRGQGHGQINVAVGGIIAYLACSTP